MAREEVKLSKPTALFLVEAYALVAIVDDGLFDERYLVAYEGPLTLAAD